MKNIFILAMVVVSACMIFNGCSKSTRTDSDGRITIYLTDKPADFDSVNIVVREISVHLAEGDSSSGWMVICDTIQYFNLLELRNGAQVLFGDDQLEPGHYNQIRLKVTDGCNLVVEGNHYDLKIPSGYQSGIKINHQFWIEENETYELLLDFDAQKSIIEKGNGEYQLKPVIRAIPMQTSGSISGTVNPEEAEAFALASPDTVSSSHTDIDGFFKLVGLPAGTYSVQIVPDDDAYADSTITDVVVVGGQTTNLGIIELRLQ
jgi:hypothetical protein